MMRHEACQHISAVQPCVKSNKGRIDMITIDIDITTSIILIQ